MNSFLCFCELNVNTWFWLHINLHKLFFRKWGSKIKKLFFVNHFCLTKITRYQQQQNEAAFLLIWNCQNRTPAYFTKFSQITFITSSKTFSINVKTVVNFTTVSTCFVAVNTIQPFVTCYQKRIYYPKNTDTVERF